MGNFKKFLSDFFLYNSNSQNYNFSLPETMSYDLDNSNYSSESIELSDENISSNIQKNLDYINAKYNCLINSDIIIRNFTIKANEMIYNAFLVCIDGMIDSNLVNNFLLKPHMQKNKNSQPKLLDIDGIKVKKNII